MALVDNQKIMNTKLVYYLVLVILNLVTFQNNNVGQEEVCPGERRGYGIDARVTDHQVVVTGGTRYGTMTNPTLIDWDNSPTGSVTISGRLNGSTISQTWNVVKILNAPFTVSYTNSDGSPNPQGTFFVNGEYTLRASKRCANFSGATWNICRYSSTGSPIPIFALPSTGSSVVFRPIDYHSQLRQYYGGDNLCVQVRYYDYDTYKTNVRSFSLELSPPENGVFNTTYDATDEKDKIYTTCNGSNDGILRILSIDLDGSTNAGGTFPAYEGLFYTIYRDNASHTEVHNGQFYGITSILSSSLAPGDYELVIERGITGVRSGIPYTKLFTVENGPTLSLNISTNEPPCHNSSLNNVTATVTNGSGLGQFNFYKKDGVLSGLSTNNNHSYDLSVSDNYSLYAISVDHPNCRTHPENEGYPFTNPTPISISKEQDESHPNFCYDTDRITNTEFGNIFVRASDYTSTPVYTITRDGASYTPENTSVNGDVTTFKVAPGNYIITATDNCNITSNTVNATIDSLLKPVVSNADLTVLNPTCPNGSGSISLSEFSYAGTEYTNGSTLTDFKFYNGISSTSFTELTNKSDFFNFTASPTTSTTYYFKIEYEDTRCPVQYDENLIYRSKVVLNTPLVKESCLDNNNGTISITSEEGNSASNLREYTIYPADSPIDTIQISNGSPAFFSELHPNVNYTITVNDFCPSGDSTDSESVPIGNFNLPSVSFSATQIECHNDSNGTLTVTPSDASGTNPSYDITLLPDDESYLDVPDGEFRIFEGLNHIDNYSVRIKDSNGCIETIIDEIPEIINPPQLEFITDSSDITDVTCWDGDDGAILAGVTGGTGQIDFSIDGGTFAPGTDDGLSYIYNFQGLRAGEYNIAIQDDFRCPLDTNYIITQPDEYSVNTPLTTGATCFGGSDGSLSVTATGGTPTGSDYTYNLMDENDIQVDSTTSTVANFTGLEFGDYYVNILDSRNCPLNSVTVSISQPQEMVITSTMTSASCYNSENITLTANVSGGSGNYTYNWKDINDNIVGSLSSIDVYRGTYFVEVIDDNNCAYGKTTPGLSPIPFKFEAIRPDTLKLNIDNQIDVDFNGLSNGSVSLSSSGGWSFHQYSIDGTNFQNLPEFNGLEAKDYTFYVKDGSNCTNSITTTITEPDLFTVNLGQVNNVNCFNGSDGQITINAEGGRPPYNFVLDDGQGNIISQQSNVFQNLTAGTYSITTRYNSYSNTVNNIIINQPSSALSSIIDTYQSPKCTFADGWATVNASGGTSPYSYNWSNLQTSVTATGLQSGDYFVEVTDFNNCIDTAFITLYDIAGPELSVSQINNIPCFDSDNIGSIALSVSGGTEPYTIQWDDPQNQTGLTASNLDAGDYSAIVTDNDGCISLLKDLTIIRPEELSATLSNFKDPKCFNDANGEITITGNGGTAPYQYQWQNITDNPTTATVTRLEASTYEVQITDANDCTATESFQLNNPEEIIIDLPDSVFICQGQTATLDAGNMGSLFEWVSENGFASDQQIINVQEQGDYVVQVSNVQGCSNSAKVHVKYENRQFYATFLMAGEATLNDTIIVIELSRPQPDSVEWYITDDFMRLTDGDAYKELIPLQTGEYSVGMKAYYAGCSEMVEKRISIIPADNSPTEKLGVEELIQSARLFPNPNTGAFEVEVKLVEEADISADVFSMKGMRVMPTKYDNGKKEYLLGFNLMRLDPGIYFVNIVAEKEVRKLKFIVN